MSVTKAPFGMTADGHPVDLFTCVNRDGLVLKLTTYGAIVVAMETPDRAGKLANVTLGFATLAGYEQRHPYFGATVGRYCNRIAKGRFTLDGQEYTLATNNGPNHLHGGVAGFDKVLWEATPIEGDEGVGVAFQYTSPDGEEGYPGALRVVARYLLTADNALRVEFEATADKPTVLNLTNHSYWNLAGAGAGSIREHRLQLFADQYLAVDDTLIPTGELVAVADTPLDFRMAKPIGRDLDEIVADPVGYDHCFVVRGEPGTARPAARVVDPGSGRVLEIETTQPGIQFYSGNFLDGTPGNGGFKQYEGFCLETQHYPDSPNQAAFPTTVLRPGETFRQSTIHRFSVESE